MVLTIIATIWFVATLSIILNIKWKLFYWKRKGLEYIEPEFFFGNIREEVTRGLSFGDQYKKFYDYFKSKGLKHGGVYMFSTPVYLPIDLEIIKNILQRDFSHFVNHGLFHVDENIDPFSVNLFNLENDKWKSFRSKLQPAFSSGT